MKVMKVIEQISDHKFTYSLMGADKVTHVHIDDHVSNNNAVMVPIEKLKELLESKK